MRDAHGGFTLFQFCRHLQNTLCQLGSCPPPRGCDLIKGKKCSAQAEPNQIICMSPLPPPALPAFLQNACSVCQMRIPGLPGQKGEKGSPGELGVEGMVGEKVKVAHQHPTLASFTGVGFFIHRNVMLWSQSKCCSTFYTMQLFSHSYPDT